MTLPRIFSPTANIRLFDPMPLPKKTAAHRRARIEIFKLKAEGAESGSNINKVLGRTGFKRQPVFSRRPIFDRRLIPAETT